MTIGFRAATTAESTSTTALTINVPAGTVDGDVLVWLLSDGSVTVAATPTGWTFQSSGTTAGSSMVIWYRVASSEPASYTTVAFVAPTRRAAVMACYSGVDNATPFDVTTPTFVAGTTAVACPAVTPVTTGAWAMGFAGALQAAGVANMVFSSANLTAIDGQKCATTASTNTAGATGHFVWTSGAFTPTYTESQASTRTLGASAALRPAGVVARSVPVYSRRAAVFRASTF